MRVVLILGIFSFSYTATAQRYIEYYRNVNEGEYYYNSGLYDAAIKSYEYAFSLESPFGIDLYRMAKCQCIQGNTKLALKYLRLTGKNYLLLPQYYFSRDSSLLTKCLTVNQLNALKIKMTRDCNKSIANVNNSANYKYLQDTIKYYIEEDQKFRRIEVNPCLDEDLVELNCDSIRRVWNEHDSLLYNQFIKFIKDNGYPRLAGELSYVILLHFHDSHYKQSRQLLIDEVNKGRMDPFFLGMMFERLELLLYGNECTYYIWRKEECNEEVWNQIRENRQSIGMSIYYNGPRVRGEFNKIKLPWVTSQ